MTKKETKKRKQTLERTINDGKHFFTVYKEDVFELDDGCYLMSTCLDGNEDDGWYIVEKQAKPLAPAARYIVSPNRLLVKYIGDADVDEKTFDCCLNRVLLVMLEIILKGDDTYRLDFISTTPTEKGYFMNEWDNDLFDKHTTFIYDEDYNEVVRFANAENVMLANQITDKE